jgi:hypothetical protein
MKIKRDSVSDGILVTMSVFTSLLLMVCPGALFWFFLPQPFGFIVMLLWGIPGPALLHWLDHDLYGPRDA